MTVPAALTQIYPGLAGRRLVLGGTEVSYAQAQEAARVLRERPGPVVRLPLEAIGNPLARCDYKAVAAPYLHLFAPLASHRGASGRPRVKLGFLHAVEQALERARAAEPARHFASVVIAARDALSSDYAVAAAVAAAAVAIQRRQHAARTRAVLRQGVTEAVAACEARRGQFTCTTPSACGTGGCRFARGPLAKVTAPAGDGKSARPANHAGGSYSLAAAEAELAELLPFRVCIKVSDGDTGHGADEVAA